LHCRQKSFHAEPVGHLSLCHQKLVGSNFWQRRWR
jgi:hypothetical protein